MMKSIPVQEAVGRVLFHDITRIVPGEFKGRAFKKGHVIKEEDVPKLLKLGKDNIYVLELHEGFVHENDAALRIARAAAGEGIIFSEPSEGKVKLISSRNGLLKVNSDALHEINSIEQIVLATLHTNQRVSADLPLAGTRIIPLYTDNDRILAVEKICAECGPVVEVKPFRSFKVGLVTTGNEVFHGRIEDKFGPVLRSKFEELGSCVINQIFTPDDPSVIVASIRQLLDEGADMIVASGGMSVDPDDRTPASIRSAGAEVVTYGAPTFPGSMFMLAYMGRVPVIGVPGCAMYHKATIFDLVVPRILAGERVTRAELVALGHGGYCLGCEECRYPTCGFGKG
ncbi:MAG: molybdopterin-binding protein [Geobacteraceae bacterium]|nr:molybdopterin-binding protein [Geobacteraceae bacterium]